MIKNLKKLRTTLGISQQKLADIIGSSQQSINKYENHNIEPDIDTLIKLANIFNTSVDYLIGNTDINLKIEKRSPYNLNTEESKLIDQYRTLNKNQKNIINMIISSYLNI